MAEQILHNHLNVLKLLNQLKEVQPAQSGTFRQFNTLTFSFKHDGQGLEKSIIAYMKDSAYTEQVFIEVAILELPVQRPLSAIEVIQFKYGNSDYAVNFNIDPSALFHMGLDQLESYCLDVFDKLHAQHQLDLQQPSIAI